LPAKRILVVEDEYIVAHDLQNLLRHMGHVPVGCAASGPDAIRMAEEESPDLILMDVELDGPMDGVTAALEIRKSHSIPIVYLTAYSQSFIHGPSRMVHPFLCIAKPFSPAAVEAALHSVFTLMRVN
jgi:CheY-like chemotaxis protein